MTATEPTRAAQEAFLRGFHDRHPGSSTVAFAAGRGPAGRSSYDVLADLARPGERVLDLGAGDGHLLARLVARGHDPAHLLAVDLSLGELRAAAVGVPGALLLQARAQALPLASSSVDLVLSHLAFTLMAEPVAVVAEVTRVLRPGGRFAAIVGGGPRGDDAFAGVLDLAHPALTAAAAKAPSPRLGDRRARTDAGLAELFAPATGFSPPTITDLPIDLSGSPDDVWTRLAPAYELATLPAATLATLHAAFLAATPRWRRPDGTIACTMATRLVVAELRR